MKIKSKSKSRVFPRQTVQKIWLGTRKSRKGAKIPSLAAFFGTLLVSGIIAGKINMENPEVFGFPALLGAAGAAYLVQRSLTKGFKKGVLIYESK